MNAVERGALSLLLERVQRLEDEHDIARLVASYGPAVDAGAADRAAGLWSDDGTYDVEGWRMTSSADVFEMVSSPAHRELVGSGCCHFLGPVVVKVDGDTAVAVCESVVLLRRAEPLPDSEFEHQAWAASAQEYLVWRAAANHFELVRTQSGWLIKRRTSRMLDGGAAGHRLLVNGLAGITAPSAELSRLE